MISRIYIFSLFFLISGCATSLSKQSQEIGPPPSASRTPAKVSVPDRVLAHSQPIEYPQVSDGESVVKRLGYSLVFDAHHKLSKWVAYHLTHNQVSSKFAPRSHTFRADFEVEGGSALPEDYKYSGYDRGHLAPAGDMAWSPQAMDDSFLMSNIAPQRPALNRGIWEKLERSIRRWAKYYGEVYVTTGPILSNPLPKLNGDVSIPSQFYKVVLEHEGESYKAIAFIIPQDFSNKNLCSYAVTVRQAEQRTGLHFFAALPNSVHDKIDSTADCNSWPWSSQAKVNPQTIDLPTRAVAGNTCPEGTILESVAVNGCCSGRRGVAGPKHHHACCTQDKMVRCKDGNDACPGKCR